MNLREDLIFQFHQHPYAEHFIQELLAARPVIPPHDAKQDNTEDWKAKSAQQKGFDLCCSFFKIKTE